MEKHGMVNGSKEQEEAAKETEQMTKAGDRKLTPYEVVDFMREYRADMREYIMQKAYEDRVTARVKEAMDELEGSE